MKKILKIIYTWIVKKIFPVIAALCLIAYSVVPFGIVIISPAVDFYIFLVLAVVFLIFNFIEIHKQQKK